MKVPFLTLLTALLTAGWVYLKFLLEEGSLNIDYFWLNYFLPGLLFSLIVLICKSKVPLVSLQSLIFLALSTGLYALSFVGSWLLVYLGICIVPSIGAYFFIVIINSTLNQKISKSFQDLTILAGPFSGGITILLIHVYEDFTLIFYLPIILWWIYMAVLIDAATLTKKAYV